MTSTPLKGSKHFIPPWLLQTQTVITGSSARFLSASTNTASQERIIFEDRACRDTKFQDQACNCEKASQNQAWKIPHSKLLQSKAGNKVFLPSTLKEMANKPGLPLYLHTVCLICKASDLQHQGTPTIKQELLTMEEETGIAPAELSSAGIHQPQFPMHYIAKCFNAAF